jgi:predicted nuclease of restriction endonuclease-like (RecB) superfamily
MAPRKAEPAAVQSDFGSLLADVKNRIQSAQVRAVLAVNAELVRLYWDIGRVIGERQRTEGWGAAVIPKLSRALNNELPELKGFSERNIKRMVAFHRDYPQPADFVPQPVAQLPGAHRPARASTAPVANPIVPQAVAQMPASLLWSVPWAHHVILMDKVPEIPLRRWYMEQTLKDPYIFDFLTLTEPFQERELETTLVRHLEKFLLELGSGFAYVGRQVRFEVAGEDYYVDLLFYHLRLRAFIVIDLKKGPFKPEYAGKLNFYCNVVNDRLRHASDQPTIGLILCQTKDRLLAEYSITGIDKPIGVSTYELTRALPTSLQSALPTVEQIEAELAVTPEPTPRRRQKDRGA